MTPRDPVNPKRRNPEVTKQETAKEFDKLVLNQFRESCSQGHTPAEAIALMIRDAKETEMVEAIHRLTQTLSDT